MTRLFLALTLPEYEAAALWRNREGMRVTSPRLRWIEASQFHITLLFFGDTESSDVPLICEAMDRGADLFPPPVLETNGPGQFPSKGQPRVIVEHLKDVSGLTGKGGLSSLHHFLYSALSPRIALEKRKFKPHITLARVSRGAGMLAFPSPVETIERGQTLHPVDLVLYESILRPEGAVYNPLYTRRLEG